ncbi:hypothetical protein CFIMG_002447RA [Ceratocystis fimbriata CBS 114723]|uniref:Uncharacterized protein n=1 Tax=Ceratocystis fimbriata CBS 114723 TaxID=1035309 RepID=A0A2C5XCE6_9PEZI|nr:hypothetical protein CFIMG_002447RA [Ceratocystis fimbriata CBS 114723]
MKSPALGMGIGLFAMLICIIGLGLAARFILRKLWAKNNQGLGNYNEDATNVAQQGISDEENQLDSVEGTVNGSMEQNSSSKVSRANTVVEDHEDMKSG